MTASLSTSPAREPITLQFTYAYEDFHYREKSSWRKEFFSYLFVGWLIVLAAGLLVFGLLGNAARGQPFVRDSSGTSSVVLLLFAAGAYLWIRFKRPNKAKWEAAHPQKPMTVTLAAPRRLAERAEVKIYDAHSTAALVALALGSKWELSANAKIGFHLGETNVQVGNPRSF